MLTEPPLLTVFGVIYAVGSVVVLVMYLTSLEGVLDHHGRVVTGDFLNFYIGGTIILEGDGEQLYDLAFQEQVQDRFTPADYDFWHTFINPPLYAVALAPLAALPFVPAFYVHAGLMSAALVGMWWLLRAHLPALRSHWFTAVIIATCFHPVIRTTIGGQNSILTLFLLAGVYTALRSNRHVLAGVFLGLLSYKPQYVPLIGLLLLWRRDVRAALAATGVGVGHYLLGAWFCGIDWPLKMWNTLGDYNIREQATADTHFSLPAVLGYVLPEPWGRSASLLAILLVLGLVIYVANRGPGRAARAPLWGLIITTTLLISPHAQYYDVAILLLPVLLGLDYVLREQGDAAVTLRIMLAIGYLGYTVYEYGETLGFQPLVFWPVLVFVWLLRLAYRRPRSATT